MIRSSVSDKATPSRSKPSTNSARLTRRDDPPLFAIISSIRSFDRVLRKSQISATRTTSPTRVTVVSMTGASLLVVLRVRKKSYANSDETSLDLVFYQGVALQLRVRVFHFRTCKPSVR